MRYTEVEVQLYWERLLEDIEPRSSSVDAVCWTDCGVTDVVDPSTEVKHG